jgi:hypothetical protein
VAVPTSIILMPRQRTDGAMYVHTVLGRLSSMLLKTFLRPSSTPPSMSAEPCYWTSLSVYLPAKSGPDKDKPQAMLLDLHARIAGFCYCYTSHGMGSWRFGCGERQTTRQDSNNHCSPPPDSSFTSRFPRLQSRLRTNKYISPPRLLSS